MLLVGTATIALWFVVPGAIAEELLYAPAALGTALLSGGEGLTDLDVLRISLALGPFWIALGAKTSVPTVFVVEDDRSVLETLRWMIDSVGLPVETYTNAREFLNAMENDGQAAGCIVLDVRMPGMSGLELQQELVARAIDLPVIMITAYGDVPTAVRALTAGAMDFIEKPFSRQLLLERIHQALEMNRRARETQARHAEVEASIAHLTPREREVMQLVVAGKTNKVMAEELGLGEKTIEVHRARVMAKMKARNLAELVRIIAGRSGPGTSGAPGAGPLPRGRLPS